MSQMITLLNCPDRPPGTGNPNPHTQLKRELDEQLQPGNQLCKHHLNPRTLERTGIKCPHGQRCAFAHSIAKVKRPESFRKHSGETAETLRINFRDWGNPTSPTFSILAKDVYPSKWSRAILNTKENFGVSSLCYTWFFTGGKFCPRWSNCWFLHPDIAIMKELFQSKFCCTSEKPETCLTKIRCPYAHTPAKLKIPRDFMNPESLASADEAMAEVYFYTSTMRERPIKVPRKYLCYTLGLDMHSNSLCEDPFCTLFKDCQRLHLHVLFWIDKVQGCEDIPPHMALKRLVSTARPPAVVQSRSASTSVWPPPSAKRGPSTGTSGE